MNTSHHQVQWSSKMLFFDPLVVRVRIAKRARSITIGLTAAFCITLAAGFTTRVLAQDPETPTVKTDAVKTGNKTAPTKKTTKPPTKNKKGKNSVVKSVEKKVILVFPIDTRGGNSDYIRDTLTDEIKARLTDRYDIASYTASLPAIRRALSEQSIRSSDADAPYNSPVKTKQLTGLTGYSYAIVSSIDDYTYDENKKQISMAISIALYDMSGAKAVSHSAAEETTATAPTADSAAISIAAKKLIDKLIAELLDPPKETPKEGTKEGNKEAPVTAPAK